MSYREVWRLVDMGARIKDRLTLSHQHELMFVLGRLQLSLQLLFGFSDALVHQLPLLFVDLVQSLPATHVFKLKSSWLGKMGLLLSLPRERRNA